MPSVALIVAGLTAAAFAQPVIPTAQYDNLRTGANLQETLLTPRNVASEQFGKVFHLPVDGDVYAQPLYIPRLAIPGKGVHDVIFVATEHNSVYAFDASGEPTEPLWQASFIDPARGINPVHNSDLRCSFIAPDVGITSTPVIDTASRTIFVVVRTRERSSGGDELFYQRLHALDLLTGAERPGSPVNIRASVPATSWFGLVRTESASTRNWRIPARPCCW